MHMKIVSSNYVSNLLYYTDKIISVIHVVTSVNKSCTCTTKQVKALSTYVQFSILTNLHVGHLLKYFCTKMSYAFA